MSMEILHKRNYLRNRHLQSQVKGESPEMIVGIIVDTGRASGGVVDVMLPGRSIPHYCGGVDSSGDYYQLDTNLNLTKL